MVQEMEIADLVNLPIQEFCKLTEQCKLQNDKARQLEAELTVHKMIGLNQQQMIGNHQLKEFFK